MSSNTPRGICFVKRTVKKATIDKAGYLNPFVHLSGSYKLAVKDLIALCREGAFFTC